MFSWSWYLHLVLTNPDGWDDQRSLGKLFWLLRLLSLLYVKGAQNCHPQSLRFHARIHSVKAISISKVMAVPPHSAWRMLAKSDIWFLSYFRLGSLWEASIYLLECHLYCRNLVSINSSTNTYFSIITNHSFVRCFGSSIGKESLAQALLGLAGPEQAPGSPDFWPQDSPPLFPVLAAT